MTMEREHRQEEESEDPGWPIGFLVLLSAAALYLGWRLLQTIGWVVGNLG